MRTRIFILCGLAALMLAAPAFAAGRHLTLGATCTGASQTCNRTVQLLSHYVPRETFTLKLTAPASHCSDVRYFLRAARPDYPPFAATSWLSRGQSQELRIDGLVHRDIHIGAEGRVGGCNSGKISGWGVDLDILVDPGSPFVFKFGD